MSIYDDMEKRFPVGTSVYVLEDFTCKSRNHQDCHQGEWLVSGYYEQWCSPMLLLGQGDKKILMPLSQIKGAREAAWRKEYGYSY